MAGEGGGSLTMRALSRRIPVTINSLAVTIINVTNHRVLADSSLTIGGFHYNDPRQVSAELCYHFHF